MKNAAITVTGIAVAVLVLVAYRSAQNDPTATLASSSASATSDADATARDAQLRNLQEQVAALQKRLADAEASMVHTAPAPGGNERANTTPPITDDTAQPAPTPSAQPMTEEERADAAKAMRENTLATLETQLAGEELDAGWAGNFQTQLEQGLKSESFAGTRLSAVTCKSSLCRVTLAHDNADMQEQFFEHMLELPVMANTQAYYQREDHPDGSTSLVLYIAREGQTLPLPRLDAPP